MASACLNSIGLSPECSQKYSPYTWFRPRLSITHQNVPDLVADPATNLSHLNNKSDTTSFDGFEFQLEDPVIMLPADELFSDGKLVPLQLSINKPDVATSSTTVLSSVDRSHQKVDQTDPYYSPRAPRCSSRWKELLGLKKLSTNNNSAVKQQDNKRTTSFASSNKSIRQLLYRNPKPTTDHSSINIPLLKDPDTESLSVSSRPSLSSSSSGHDVDDLPRLSLDSDKPTTLNRPKTRMMKTRTTTETRVGRPTRRRSTEATNTIPTNRCLSVDSPRINSSGKIVFHSLERSSSSPSTLIGGSRNKHRGMERSYSGNVRISPVLNVPVCSLRGFQMFSSQQKREGCSSSNNNRSQRFNGKLRGECC